MQGYVTGDAWWAPPPERPFLEEVGIDPGRLRVTFHPHPGVPSADECAPANRQAPQDARSCWPISATRSRRPYPRGMAIRSRRARRSSLPLSTPHTRSSIPYPPLDTLDPVDEDARGDGQARSRGRVRQERCTGSTGWRAARSRSSTTTTCSCRPRSRSRRPRIGSMAGAGIDDMLRFLALTPFTALWNTTGRPAVSLPLRGRRARAPGRRTGRSHVTGGRSDALAVVRRSKPHEPWRDRRPPVS